MERFFSGLGDFCRFSWLVARRVFARRTRVSACVEQMYRIGVESVTVVNLCSFFIGLVLVLQTAAELSRFGAKSQVSSIIWASFVREIGPVFAAIMFTGRSGTSIAAELGSMVVTEQIDAYRALGADPISRLVVPRVLATALMLPALTVIACLVGIFSGYVLSTVHLGVSGDIYLQYGAETLTHLDVVVCLAKGFAFGIVVGLISTWLGLRTTQATESVGAATTKTMVAGVLTILIVDLFLTQLFLVIQDA